MMKNDINQILYDLTSRLTPDFVLQYESNGRSHKARFSFADPAPISEIDDFIEETGWFLPDDYKDYIMIHNGSVLFFDLKYGGYIHLLSLDEIPEIHNKFIDQPTDFYPIATINGNLVCIDSLMDEQNYIVWYSSITGDTINLQMNFTEWLDKLITHNGREFW